MRFSCTTAATRRRVCNDPAAMGTLRFGRIALGLVLIVCSVAPSAAFARDARFIQPEYNADGETVRYVFTDNAPKVLVWQSGDGVRNYQWTIRIRSWRGWGSRRAIPTVDRIKQCFGPQGGPYTKGCKVSRGRANSFVHWLHAWRCPLEDGTFIDSKNVPGGFGWVKGNKSTAPLVRVWVYGDSSFAAGRLRVNQQDEYQLPDWGCRRA